MRAITPYIIVLFVLLFSLGCRDLVIGGTPLDAGDTASTGGSSTVTVEDESTDSSSDTTVSESDSEMQHMDGGPHMDTDRPMGGDESMMDKL